MWGVASLLLAAIACLAVWNLKPAPAPPPKPVTRTVINLPPGQQFTGLGVFVAISPDGTHLAYIAAIQGGVRQLYLRAMDSLESKPIPGTEGASNPFFSLDSQWLGFFAGGKLKKISVSGGAEVTLGDAVGSRGASWGSQGMIAFTPTQDSPLQQVSDAGGAPQPLTRLEKGDLSQSWPESSCQMARQCSSLAEIPQAPRFRSTRLRLENDGTCFKAGRNPGTRPPGTWFTRKGET